MMLEADPAATPSTSIATTETSPATTLSPVPQVQFASPTAQIASTAQTASTSTVTTPQVQPTSEVTPTVQVAAVPQVQGDPASPAASTQGENIEPDSTPTQKGNLYFKCN